MLVPMKEILDKAVEKNCAVPALWGGDLITSEAALMQAEEMKTGVLRKGPDPPGTACVHKNPKQTVSS